MRSASATFSTAAIRVAFIHAAAIGAGLAMLAWLLPADATAGAWLLGGGTLWVGSSLLLAHLLRSRGAPAVAAGPSSAPAEEAAVPSPAGDATAQEAARRAVAESERWFQALFESATDAIFVSDMNARFVNVNQRACDSLGYERDELLAMGVTDIDVDVPLEVMRKRWQSADFLAGYAVSSRLRRKDGSLFPVEFQINGVVVDGRTYCLAIARDITRQRQAEEAMKAGEEFTRAILDASPAHLAVLDRDGWIIAVNEAWRRFGRENAGDARNTGVGMNFVDICRDAARDGDATAMTAAHGALSVLVGGRGHFSMECQCDTPQGRRFFLMDVTPLQRAAGHALVTYTDITDIKAAQEMEQRLAEQFKALARKHLDIQEQERHHLSLELHDHIGQTLASLKLLLHDMHNREAAHTLAGNAAAIVDDIAAAVRDIARRLRPPLLDELGLPSAVNWFIRNLPTPAGVRLHFDEDVGDSRFPEAIELACFRIIQEAVANALRHAQASTITIRIACAGDRLCLAVEDDGKGFDVDRSLREAQPRLSLGLIGMRERVASNNGNFDIRSASDGGTIISACFPRTQAA